MGIERRKEIDKTITVQRAEDADKFANKMKQLHQFLREEMTYVQAIQESLPSDSNAYPVFYMNKLRLAPNDSLPGQQLPPPPLLKISDITE